MLFLPAGLGIGKANNLPTRSLSFVRASNQNLSIPSSDFGSFDLAKNTISLWVKRASLGTVQAFYQKAQGGTQNSFIHYFDTNDRLNLNVYQNGTAVVGELVTNATFLSTTSFYHLKIDYDSANATSGDRLRLEVNGVRETSLLTYVAPTAAMFSGTDPVRIGGDGSAGTNYDGKIYQPAMFTGLNPSGSLLYQSGKPLDISTYAGLKALSNTNAVDALEDDYVLATNLTNNNGVTKSTDIP